MRFTNDHVYYDKYPHPPYFPDVYQLIPMTHTSKMYCIVGISQNGFPHVKYLTINIMP